MPTRPRPPSADSPDPDGPMAARSARPPFEHGDPRALQSIFDAMLMGVVLLDETGRVDLANSEAARLLGTSDQQLAGTHLSDHLDADHPVSRVLAEVHRLGRAAIHDEVEVPRRQAPALPVDITVAPIREPRSASAGEPRIAITLRDRTASKSLQEEVLEQERQESYGHIAAGIAHEVKNPLGGIRGAAELLSMRSGDDRSKQTADLIVGEVDRISRLVDEMMVFARGDHLQVSRVNIHQLLDAMMHLLSFEKGHENVRIERRFDPSLPEIEADPARLQQIFLNLARNALQAMEGSEGGGTLTLTTRMQLEQRLVGPDGRPRPTIEIRFSDTGPGIPAPILDRLSTPFFTTKRKGTGLGLSVARHWIGRHGGRLRIASAEGQGTRVSVDLGLRPPAGAERESAPGGAEASR